MRQQERYWSCAGCVAWVSAGSVETPYERAHSVEGPPHARPSRDQGTRERRRTYLVLRTADFHAAPGCGPSLLPFLNPQTRRTGTVPSYR